MYVVYFVLHKYNSITWHCLNNIILYIIRCIAGLFVVYGTWTVDMLDLAINNVSQM